MTAEREATSFGGKRSHRCGSTTSARQRPSWKVMTMSDLDQQRRTVRALELLGDSHVAYAAGDIGECDRLRALAGSECGEWTVVALLGGMQTGEIPQPGDDGWPHYLVAQQDALARNEEGGTRDDRRR